MKTPTQIVARGGLSWVESRALAPIPWLLHAFSTRVGGASQGPCRGLNLGFIESDRRQRVEQNRAEFFAALGVEGFSLAELKQTHSTHVYQVALDRAGQARYMPAGSGQLLPAGKPPPGDALVTNHPDVLLSIRTADCHPILLADPRRRAVAAIHAGWRGTLARIAEKTVGVMRAVFGSNPRDLTAAIGPGIQSCCYAVGEEVVSKFHGRFVHAERYFKPVRVDEESAALVAKYPNIFLSPFPPGHEPMNQAAAHLDLAAALRDHLLAAGLPLTKIDCSKFCTACRTDLFFSHRQEGPRTGRMMAVIGMRD